MHRKYLVTFLSLAVAFVFTACESDSLSGPTTDVSGPLAPAKGEAHVSPSVLTTASYGDVVIDGAGHWFPGGWDLSSGPITLRYEADLTGARNNAAGGWTEIAVGLRNPTSGSGARMSGFLWDGDNAATPFPTYPDRPNSQDIDDKFNLQRFPNPGVWSELMYDVHCGSNTVAGASFGSHSNYGIWFDRDGVDQWQDDAWGALDGGTYDTGGTYDVEILFRTSSGKGTACPTFSPDLFNGNNGVYGVPTGFVRQAGGSYAIFPAGLSWDPADDADFSEMRLLVEGNAGDGTMVARNLTVTGYLTLTKESCNDGDWSYFGFENQGQCVRFVTTGKDSR